MTKPRFLLTSTMRVMELPTQRMEASMQYCERCAGKFSEADFRKHDATTCRPIDELITDIVKMNEPVACPLGCGIIHPLDVRIHRSLGCKAATEVGHGPFATGSELSLAD